MKKIVALLVCFTVIFNSSNISAEETDVQKGIDFLLENGYTYEDIINQFPEEDLAVISQATSINSIVTCCEIDEDGEVIQEDQKKIKTASIVPGSKTESTSGGKLTQAVTAFGLSDSKALLTYSFTWNKTPVNRKVDCCALFFDGAKLSEVRSAYYQYTSRNLYTGDDELITKHRPTSTSSSGIGISFNIANDKTHAGGIKDHQSYKHKGYISCYAKITSSKCVNVWSRYYHQQGILSLSPSISITGVSLSLSSNTQMKLMTPNPYLQCNIKK